MKVFISTGGFSKLTGLQASNKLLKNKLKDVELSGGLFENNSINKIAKLKKKLNFRIHNYFPPPQEPFVLNVASLDRDVAKKSMDHVYSSIKYCKKLNSDFYSFHAGFLCDPKINALGKKFFTKKLFNRNKCIKLFLKRINKISKFAAKLNIKILIENNVLNSKYRPNENPFLMADEKEILKILKKFPKNVKLLMDVAHLKVSSQTLKFNALKALKRLNPYIGGYHLSDNDGKTDSNDFFSEKSWFWEDLRKDLDYYSIEVYSGNVKKIYKLHNRLIKFLNIK
tara:strand:+ start:3896 stop:4744 length:849 start_codon:yes stop_codon:yes gene_type:complete